jgi:hypothetical protein
MNKLLLISLSILLSITIANASTTVCYKKNWSSPSTIETTLLDGGKCAGKYSITQMKEMGWNILDIKIDSSKENLSYQYLLSNDTVSKKIKAKNVTVKKIATSGNKQLSFKASGVKLNKIENNQTTIEVGNLIIGQSGVVIHIYDNDKRMIIANAEVISSNQKTSIVKFSKFNDLKQDAMPTSNREVASNDILVLNYLYTSSLLIAPNLDTFQTVRSNFKYNTFLHSDIFASKLKIEEKASLTKDIIKNYAIAQNLGTIFIVVNKNIYVIDTKTFKILTSYGINYEEDKYQLPFYTRVENIDDSILDITFFSSTKNLDYETYYKKLLGLI